MSRRQGRPILEPADANPWTCLEAGYLADAGGFRVRRDRVLLPDGSPGVYTFVEGAADFTVVVALDAAGCVTLVRQWRYPWGASAWELPAGHLEPGETALAAGQRELAEEAGLAATDWLPLAVLRPAASMTTRSHVYLARGLTTAPQTREESERDMVTRRLPLAAAIAAVAAGDIVHAMTVSALFLAERALAAPQPADGL